MATGTGLPLQEKNPAIVQSGGAPATFNGGDGGASDWARIATMGDKLQSQAGHELGLEVHQAQVGYLADQNVEIARKRIEMRDQFASNPDGFDAAWAGYTEGKVGQAEPWALPHIKKLLGTEGNAAYSAILGEKRSEDKRLDVSSIDALAKMAANDVLGTAMAGTFNSPEGQAKVEKFRAVMATAVTSKLIAPEEAERRIVDVTNRATAETLIKHIGDDYRTNRANGEIAGPAALKAAEETILRNPALPLSEEQRYAYYHKATAEIRALEAERKQDLSVARAGMQDAMYAMARGVRVDPGTIDSLSTQLSAAGGQAEVAKLRAAAARAENMSAFGRLPLGDQVTQYRSAAYSASATSPIAKSAYDYFVGQGYSKSQAAGIVGNLLHESGLDPTISHDQGTGIGIAGWRLERRQALREFAAARGTSETDFKTQLAFVDHELKTSEPGARTALMQAQTPQDAAVAFIRFERPKGYNETNPALAHGASNRVGLARAVAEATGGAAPDGRPVVSAGMDFRLVSAQKTELDKSSREEWKRIQADLDAGIRPTPDALNSVIQGFTLTGNHDALETVGARLDRFDAKFAAGRQPQAVAEGAAHELTRIGETEGLSPGQSAWLKDLWAVNKATTEALDKDPIGLAVERFPERFQTPAPLNAASSDTLRAGLAQRGKIASFVSENYRVPAVSALSPADLNTIKGALATADAAGKARIYNDITAALPEGVRIATISQLTKDGHVATVEAFAGALSSEAPLIGESIMRGQQAIKADKRFDPYLDKKDDFNSTFDKALPIATFGLTSRTDDKGAYATIKSAVRARYADLAAQAGDTSGEVKEERIRQAVTDVTGGVLHHNGGTLVAPRRGMDQSQFDGLIWNITDQDLFGVTTLSGTPVAADYLRSNARLENVGDGKYLLQLGKDPQRPIYAFMNARDPFGEPTPYVLDLKNRTGRLPTFSETSSQYLQTVGMPTGN
jgi:hypothetical protein